MIEQLLAVLSAAGLTPTPRELRDALWLAEHIVVTREPLRTQPPGPQPSTPTEAAPTTAAPTAGLPSPSSTSESPSTALYAAGSGASRSVQATAARSPAVPALRHKADLIRALRPFRRRSPSTTTLMVDEDATATRIAAEGLWLPVRRPAPARWLELTLVVDTTPSMVVWRRTIAEFRTLAERLGAFRRVRTFGLDGSGAAPLTVVPNLAGDASGLDPATLVDPSRRQAILVITDGVGAAWRDGRVQPLLRRWANTGPVAVTTVLPQRMWAGTELRVIAGQVRTPRPGAANTEWIARDPSTDVPVPVLSLSARWLAPWAQLVAGAGDWRRTALLAEPAPTSVGRRRAGAAGSAKDIVGNFRTAVSPTAFRLACYLSAAWLNLPVMRLVQQIMLPESDLTHLAEVFLGGLLHRISDDPETDPDTVQYEFASGVRDELNGYLLRDELLTVLQRSSEFVAERFGQSFDFAALLADPDGVELPAVVGETGGRPLAHVAASVLAKLGGRYRTLAERLTSRTIRVPPADTRKEFTTGESAATDPRIGLQSATYGEETWAAWVDQIAAGSITPVIGPLLAKGILGSRQDIARDWVRRWEMPIAAHGQDDLAQAAQDLRVRTSDATVRTQLQSHLMNEIRERRNRAGPTDLVWQLPARVVEGRDPMRAIAEVGKRLRIVDRDDPYHILAELTTSVYVTTDWTNLLQDALAENGRQPITMAFHWNDPREKTDHYVERPTVERPLVYHLYGRLDDLESLVLSEDDYFAWLNAWTVRRKSIPSSVLASLATRSLLFLGYRHPDDWDFRMVLQSVWRMGGSMLLSRNPHVAVLPRSENLDIERLARELALKNISIYWGENRQFLDEMRRHWIRS